MNRDRKGSREEEASRTWRTGGNQMEEKMMKYGEICERAEKMGIQQCDREGSMMDIESADKKFNLRLDEWLKADDFNFAHDFYGIQDNIERGSFPATDFGLFVPRFAGMTVGGI